MGRGAGSVAGCRGLGGDVTPACPSGAWELHWGQKQGRGTGLGRGFPASPGTAFWAPLLACDAAPRVQATLGSGPQKACQPRAKQWKYYFPNYPHLHSHFVPLDFGFKNQNYLNGQEKGLKLTG